MVGAGALQLAQEGGPLGAAVVVVVGGGAHPVLDHRDALGVHLAQVLARARRGGGRLDLHRARLAQVERPEEGLRRRAAEGVVAVVMRDDDVVARDRLAEQRGVLVVLGKVVAEVCDVLPEIDVGLAHRAQSALGRGYRHHVLAVRVDEEAAVGARAEDPLAEVHSAVADLALARVRDEALAAAAGPDAGAVDHRAVQAHLDEVRGADLLEQEPVRVDEEAIRLAMHAGADLLVGDVGHAVEVHDPVEGGELDAGGPLRLRVA